MDMPSDTPGLGGARPDDGQALTIKGSEAAPFLYVEDFLDASWGGGVAKFRLVRLRRSDEQGDEEAYVEVVAILAMSAENLADAYRFIGQTIERMKESGDYRSATSGDNR
jgi:hypothetical protein